MKCNEKIKAFDFYYRAKAYERILDLFEQPGAAELLDKAPQLIIRAFSEMDKSLKLSRPIPYITYIYSYLISVDMAEGKGILLEAKNFYESQDNLPNKERILGEIALVESFLYFNEVPLMNQFHKKAFTLLGGKGSQISNHQAVFTFGSPHTLFLYHKEKGGLLPLVEMIQKDFCYYLTVSNGCGTGYQYLALAEYYLETGQLPLVELEAQKAILKAQTKGQMSIIICGNLCLARLEIFQGKPQEALDRIHQLRQEVEFAANPLLYSSLEITEGYIFSVLGKLDLLPKWLQDGDLSQCNLTYHGMGISFYVIGGTAILRENYVMLEIIVESMYSTYEYNHHLFGFIYTGIFDAIAKYHLYGLKEAKEALRPAIEIGKADGIVTPFAERIEQLKPILLEMRDMGDHDWFEEVFSLGDTFSKGVHLLKNPIENKLLTDREQEVLLLLSKGLTQKKIAEKIYISQNTVRRHLQNIYDKLGVKNSIMAINKAKAMHIIP